MSDSGMRLLRKVLTILPFVQRNQGIRVSELATLTGIPEAEIVRDLPDLVNLCGVPPYSPMDLVDLAVEGDRVTIRFADAYRRPVRLTLREALALEMALSGWEKEREGPFRNAVRAIREKVRRACSPEVAKSMEQASERIVAAPPPGLAGRMVGVLKDALARQREVTLTYFSRSQGRLSRRVVRPYGIYEQRGHWYAVAFDTEKKRLRTFRADRIKDAGTTGRDYEIPEEFDVAAFRREEPPEPEAGATEVLLRFEEEAARFAEEGFPAQEKKRFADGSLRAVVRTGGRAWIISELLRWGARVMVESPPDVVADLVDRARRTLERYGRRAE
ncbi:MAG: WYL domain-containing protein [Planctomycetes bacterium]|jgi:proteasome accessory factor C|nr:WYL domain-containing protein [Planctomycetota bacterium]